MKKFEFTLGRVLDFKNQLLEREKNELARLRQEKHAMETQIAQLEQSFMIVSEEMEQKSMTGTTSFELKSYHYQLDTIRMTQKDINRQIEAQDQLIDEQMTVVLEMQKDVSGLDKLKAHQKELYRQAVAKQAESEIAEYVSGKIARSTDEYMD